MHRRRFLLTAGTGATVGLAGCGGNGSSGTDIDDHGAAADLESQPRFGSLDGNVVLAFEDPSCPGCGRFHAQTVPEIRENVVDPGEGAFVLRNYPIIYPWGEPATRALEATFDRDEGAHWDLQSHYYDEQSSFHEENVLDRTATFLNEETAVDGDGVVDAVDAGEYDAAVQADLDAAEDGDVGRSTPAILVFSDGEHQTTANGAVDYDVIAGALDVE